MKGQITAQICALLLSTSSLFAVWTDPMEGPMEPHHRWDLGWARQGIYLGPPEAGFALDNLQISFSPDEKAPSELNSAPSQSSAPMTEDSSASQILISWDNGDWKKFAHIADGITGHATASHTLDEVGSLDGTFGANILDAEDQIKKSIALTADSHMLNIRLENKSPFPIDLTGIHFDSARLTAQSMTSLRLLYWSGGLEIPPAHILHETNSLPIVSDQSAAWNNADVSLADEHHQLAPGTFAQFKIVGAGGTEPIAIDNIAITGRFSDAPLVAKEQTKQRTGSSTDTAPEVLYNGITLASNWPPRNIQANSEAPMEIPYLETPPETILIDVGRQLFVDDFLIENTDMERRFIMPIKYEENPVLKPETALEKDGPNGASAAPLSGGIWWDHEKQLFNMWYGAGFASTLALATSSDGINWDRPELPAQWGTIPGTNQVLPTYVDVDTYAVIPEWNDDGDLLRYTLSVRAAGSKAQPSLLYSSEDGIRWSPLAFTGGVGDKTTHFYNPFRKKWVYSIRSWPNKKVKRSRSYWESEVFEEGNWHRGEPPFWLRTDSLDLPDPEIGEKLQLYNFDAVAYESIMLGFFQVLLGPENDHYSARGIPKITELQFAYSRDGFHFDRPDRRAHIPAERKDAWDRGYVQSVAGACVIMGDELWIYYAGFRGDTELKGKNVPWKKNGMYQNGATGFAKLRRDGFAAMEAGNNGGSLTTRPLQFNGTHLFVNANTEDGELRAEIRDLEGRPIEPFTLTNSVPFSGDSTLEGLNWKGVNDLSALAGGAVRLHFELSSGQLYSFWISQDQTGRSDGYLGAGGPGYIMPRDTKGKAALQLFDSQ